MTIETREVLADAYLGPNKRRRNSNGEESRMLSHACEIDARGEVLRVLCGRVSRLSMADRFASDASAVPTCEHCQSRLRRVQP